MFNRRPRNVSAGGPRVLGDVAVSLVPEFLALVEVVPGPRFRYLDVNDAALASGPRSREEVVGHYIDELLQGEEGVERVRRWTEVVRSGEPARYCQSAALPDRARVIETTVTPIPDGSGAVRHLLTVGRDVTERVHAEEVLRASQQQFRSLLEHSSDVITVLEPDGSWRWSSAAGSKLLGYPRDHDARDWVVSLLHPDDVEATLGAVAEVTAGRHASEVIVARVRGADGTWHYLETMATNLIDNPAVHGIVLNSRDVTERVRAEEALRDSEERFRSAFEHAPIGIGLADNEGRILRSNQAFASMLGRTPDDLIGIAIRDLTHPDDWADSGENIRRLFTGEITRYQMEKRYLHADGHTVWGSLSVSAVRDPNGIPLYMIGQIEDVTDRKVVGERLAHQAVHDPLTGLPNRARFIERLRVALGRSGRRHRVAVLFLDLDHFKVINDSLGHEAGDQLLVTIGHRLRGILRPNDTVARFGGDEFAILCEDLSDPSTAMQMAERTLAAIARPFFLVEEEVFVTASIGIACSSHRSETPATLVRDADTAMYGAKDQGRARAEFFDERFRVRTLEHLHTGNALHHALARGEFALHYQPIFDLEIGRVSGFEALLRWYHTDQGLVAPAEFIGLAEETGLIVPIGAWALETACRQAARWQAHHDAGPALSISVNLSPRQLADPSLSTETDRILKTSGIRPDSLWLEITETTLMQDTESAISALRALRAQGIHLAIDDFGTGYSSLNHLKRLPIDALKIDQSFIHGLARDHEDTAIVTAVISLAHALGLTTIAEGVETPQQLAELRTLGCELAQGHLFAPPAPAAELTDHPTEHLGPWAKLTNNQETQPRA